MTTAVRSRMRDRFASNSFNHRLIAPMVLGARSGAFFGFSFSSRTFSFRGPQVG